LDKSFLNEVRAAARGVLALLLGDRRASDHFVFTQAGLISSFIAVLITTTVVLVVTSTLGPGGLFTGIVQNVIIYVALVGASALYLRQIGRFDALMPFMVALNWSNALMSVVMLVVVLLGLSFLVLVMMVAGIVVTVNIARLIMTLKPLQIVLLILAQVVGLFAAILLFTLLFPPSPEELARIMEGAGSLPS
jgi:hypothetical protein